MQKDEQQQARSSDAPRAVARRTRTRALQLATGLVAVVVVLLWWHPWQRDAMRGTPGAHASGAATGSAGRPPGAQRGGGAFANMPQPVKVATVVHGQMPIVINALGTVTPLATVTVRTQLNGTLMSVNFQEGQLVKRGDVLAQIDPRPYEISLRNAEGQLAKDQALLRQAVSDLNAYQALLKQDSISRQQVNTQASLVEQYRGQVKSDQATIDTYKLDLTYARITAPVTGRVGLRQVDPGNYVTTSDTNGIVVITQMQPMSVVFTTSEDNLQAILKQWTAGAKMSATVYDRTNSRPLETGELHTIDNQIDTTTGTVKLRAVFQNARQALFPNQFVNVRLLVDTIRNATLVPTSAVLNGSMGTFVYVVKADNTVTVRPVKTGAVDGERTSIVSGLAVGERVVIEGSDRLREGAKITIPAATASGSSAASAGQAARDARHASAVHGHTR
ncbi:MULTISPECIES: MdtA/MuxA family multidrug efflux RND transporter periplasmic adaptor subunit [Burkholderiaceae]|uniref:MdtA/MuxA family multidrug efflux RND transporter periplasmic adaptor subunit n=1 Tax=Burkholderiaceae TaxID=119060 RepID=UPI00096609CA|nr:MULTISPECIES: MdtA/MuxA family multidrug efflux RND transporter periplasmic adaptor subunit [Burkholderiaceae]MCF2134147.1 MdtA/MuxA family multidrug efflux RND transporter periplasmic adaptor subunit [Mycetohabitans sp. B3]MCG1039697.1 MdtA/MuxA family multidrug efflux RND transporter periplasmic adaptor subunit [Mycetohabitans sp. B7]SIT70629.1 membrane fusion protein, multidrug efflux system [Burkholderia sp. b14]